MGKTIILGSGISGLSAGFHLKKNGIDSEIYEKNQDWGGLCSNFEIDGFRFDKFVHFTFTNDEYIRQIFESKIPLLEHPAISNNYYKGFWLKHPAQNNLFPLPLKEKFNIIKNFTSRKRTEISDIKNYAEWLQCQYGDYFAHNFPFAYTRKYWGKEAEELETKWVGNRMHSPSLIQVLKGAFFHNKKNFYYTNVMRYPEKGGFKSILCGLHEDLDIKLNKKAVEINTEEKLVKFEDGEIQSYQNLISSIPLPEIVKIIKNCPQAVLDAANKLKHTCGYMVSLGFNREDIAKDLWFYIYDEDILSARVYSPSLKSKDNVPTGYSSIQAEIFFANDAEILSPEVVLKNTIEKLSKIMNFKESEILVKDIRFEKYANVIFDHKIYENRKIVLDYLVSVDIKSIGRFGKWEYMWTNQAFMDGKSTAEDIIHKLTADGSL